MSIFYRYNFGNYRLTNWIQVENRKEESGAIEFGDENMTMTPCAFTRVLRKGGISHLRITLRKVGGCPFALVNFVMNFYNVGFSVCHSFRSLSQCGRVRDFKGCFKCSIDALHANRIVMLRCCLLCVKERASAS